MKYTEGEIIRIKDRALKLSADDTVAVFVSLIGAIRAADPSPARDQFFEFLHRELAYRDSPEAAKFLGEMVADLQARRRRRGQA